MGLVEREEDTYQRENTMQCVNVNTIRFEVRALFSTGHIGSMGEDIKVWRLVTSIQSDSGSTFLDQVFRAHEFAEWLYKSGRAHRVHMFYVSDNENRPPMKMVDKYYKMPIMFRWMRGWFTDSWYSKVQTFG